MKLRIYVDLENDQLFELVTSERWRQLQESLESLAKTEIPCEIQFIGKLQA